ncbi:MAG: hypothetical protein AB7G07_01850 [Bauldia sp.]
MFDLSGQEVLFRIGSALLITATHAYALAVIAAWMGDPGPGYDERRTLNPLQHVQPLGFLSIILFRVGWVKPMAIDPKLLRGGKAGLFVIVLGALAVTLVIAFALLALRAWVLTTFAGASAAQSAVLWFENVAIVSAGFAVFNLIPIPPFTAGLLLAGYAPRLHGLLTRRIVIPALVFTVALFAADAADLVDPAVRAIARWFYR